MMAGCGTADIFKLRFPVYSPLGWTGHIIEVGIIGVIFRPGSNDGEIVDLFVRV
jgi:hypothetical protein